MTTQTKDPPETTEDARRWTFREVDKQAATLENVRARLEALKAREEELGGEIADALAAGEEADISELREERRKLREEREDLSAACDVLEQKIDERREAAACAKLEELLGTVHKKVSGNAGEHPRRLERLEEARQKVTELEEKVEKAKALQKGLTILATVAVDRADLDFPDWKILDDAPRGPFSPSGVLKGHRDPPRKRVQKARRILGRTFGSDSKEAELADAFMDVLEKAGERPLGAEGSWDDKLRAERQASKERTARERREARERIDTWLRETLRSGPISDQALKAECRRQGFEISRDPYSRDLMSALRRVGAVTGRGRDGGRLWGLQE